MTAQPELAALRDGIKYYGTRLIVAGVGFALLAHLLTDQPMPWWPDTVIMGVPAGFLVAMGSWQHRRTNRFIWNALKGALHRRA